MHEYKPINISPVTASFWAEEDGGIIGYMCKVDFECELGGALGGNRVYPDIEDLRKQRPCVDQCGIVEVRVYATRIVQEENFDFDAE